MAVVRRIGFTRFSRWGDNLGRLAVSAASHVEALDGTDELRITCDDDVNKGDYVVWTDWRGVAHEHIVDDVRRTHDEKGALSTSFTAVNSVAELWDDWNDDLRPSGSVAAALERALSGTRWKVGTCDQAGSASAVLYHQSARESIAQILDTWGGELETTVQHDGTAVAARFVGVRSLRGNQSSPKRFTWTKDIKNITRTVSSENPKTRVYGFGKGVETDGGGYGRRLTFAAINGGKAYVEDADATRIWGHPGAGGTILPACTAYVNEQCEDASQLLRETEAYAAEVSQPKVSYTASVLDLYAFGRSWEGVAVGDRVAVIDKGFCEDGIRLTGRVSQIERDLISADATVTFGNLSDSLADMWQSVSQALKSNSLRSATYDAVAGTSVNWLIQLQDALNEQFKAVGTYKLETFELGAMFSNVPLHPETGLPLKTTSGMWAVNISGRGIRLASSLASNGQWDWRTFLTGASVTANCINAGTMHADRIRAGLLTDETGSNSWDLDNGEFSLSATANVGGSDAGDLVVLPDVQYGLSSDVNTHPASWTTTALWQQGKHLWTRVKMTHADGSITYTTPRRIANDKGMGASEVIEQYYLSTSSTAQTGGSWQNSQPAWVKGRYYWTRSRITWSDGSVTYTTPQLARALTAANQSTNDLDEELTQREIFNRLTNNGKTQGVYLSNGLLYINATYLKTGIISDAYGRNSWNLANGTLTTNYMTANNVTAKGTFECGGTYGIKLNSTGQLAGYRNGSQVGYIDYSSSMRDVNTGVVSYGIQMQCQGSLRMTTPQLSIAKTSDVGVTATYGGTGSLWVTGFDHNPGDGWDVYNQKAFYLPFINGICTRGF